jgi:hypothetical protein
MMKTFNTQLSNSLKLFFAILSLVMAGVAPFPRMAMAQRSLGEKILLPISPAGARPEVHVAGDSVYVVYRTEGRPGAFKVAVLDTLFSQRYRERTLVETAPGGNVTDIRIKAGVGAIYMAYEITPAMNVATEVRLERVTSAFDATGDLVTVTDRNDKTYGHQFLDDAPVLVRDSTVWMLTKLGGGAPANSPYRLFEFQQNPGGLVFVTSSLIETQAQAYPGVSYVKTETPLFHDNRILLVYGMEVGPGVCSSAPRNALDADLVLHEYTADWQPGAFHILPPVPGPDGEPDAIETYPIGFAKQEPWLFIAHVAVHRSLFDCEQNDVAGHSPDGGTLWLHVLDANTLAQVTALQLTNLNSGESFVCKHPTIAATPGGRIWVVYSSNESDSAQQVILAQEILQSTTAVVSRNENMAQPQQYALHQNYPNPFTPLDDRSRPATGTRIALSNGVNPSTTIRFTLPQREQVTLKVFDVSGREVETLVKGEMAAVEHHVTFAPAAATSGLYFYQITAGNFSQTLKAILMK